MSKKSVVLVSDRNLASMKFILGKKENMTQVFTEEGKLIPVTKLSVGPVVVTQVKDLQRDGYKSVQIGYGAKKEKRVNKALKGHFKNLGLFSYLKEFPVDDKDSFSVGDTINVSSFAPGDSIVISGISKGKGFQSVIKRHGFKGGPRSHGQKHSEREPGSIGGGLRNKVPKGMRMAGRTGNDRVTLKSSKVIAVNPETNEILVSGPIPGRRGTIIEISAK